MTVYNPKTGQYEPIRDTGIGAVSGQLTAAGVAKADEARRLKEAEEKRRREEAERQRRR